MDYSFPEDGSICFSGVDKTAKGLCSVEENYGIIFVLFSYFSIFSISLNIVLYKLFFINHFKSI